MKDLILDIGVGQGGRYLNSDDGKKHVGMDIVWGKLLDVQEEYWRANPHLVLANGFDHLPFKSEVFSRINVYFPYLLFYGLINSNYALWPEMRRVLKIGGELDIVFDLYKDRFNKITKKVEVPELGIDEYLYSPVERVKAAGKMHGFELEDVPTTPLAVQQEIGSYFSQRIYRSSEQSPGFIVTRLQAIKEMPQALAIPQSLSRAS